MDKIYQHKIEHTELILKRVMMSLFANHPFFATLLLKLRRKPVENYEASFATDGKYLFYNPDVVLAMEKHELRDKLLDTCVVIKSPDELKGTLAHEGLHPGLGHHTRRGHRDPKDWNIACDAVINVIIRECGLSLPEGAIDYPWAKGMTAEAVYDRIHITPPPMPPNPECESEGNDESGSESEGDEPEGEGEDEGDESEGEGDGEGDGEDEPKGEGEGEGDGEAQPSQQPGQGSGQPQPANTPGGFGQILDAPVGTPEEREAEEREWRITMQQAADVAKTAGKLPGNLARLAEDSAKPKLDWKEILRRFIDETMATDVTWTRPNRRYIAQGLYLPGVLKEGCGPMLAAEDASGSIGQREFDVFNAEIKAIHEEVKPSLLTMCSFDAEITASADFYPGDEIKFDAVGGGGTDFRPIFDWVATRDEQPRCVIVLTDMYGTFPREAPEIPTLWVSTTEGMTAPFGETVYLNLED